MKEGFFVNGGHTYGTYQLRVLRRSVTAAPKDDYTERVPYSSVTYDLGGICGRQSYGERSLTFVLEFICRRKKRAQDKLIDVISWLHWTDTKPLYDDLLPDYHYEVREPTVSWAEDHGIYTITASFPAAPEIKPNSNKTDNAAAAGLPEDIDESDVTLPDVNGDGSVNAVDASMILSAYSKISTGQDSGLTDEQLRAADADMDGRVTASDATLVMGFYSALSAGKYECTAAGWTQYLVDMKNSGGVI